MLLPGLTIGILFIASMIIRFVRKMKKITVEKYCEVPAISAETRRKMEEIFRDQEKQLTLKEDSSYESDIYLAVDRNGRLVEEFKHPV